jgi:hypothetical protein
MTDTPTTREVAIAILLCVGYLTAAGLLDERDQRIAALEAAQATCIPVRPKELAVAQMDVDGRIECAIHAGPHGNRTISRLTY